MSHHTDGCRPDVECVLFSDASLTHDSPSVYARAYLLVRCPKHTHTHTLQGALYIEDFIRLCQAIGFTDPRVLHKSAELVSNEELEAKLGEAKFYSVTYRLFKMPEGMLETKCEDYGQVAVYKGTIPGRCVPVRPLQIH